MLREALRRMLYRKYPHPILSVQYTGSRGCAVSNGSESRTWLPDLYPVQIFSFKTGQYIGLGNDQAANAVYHYGIF
jgi:hypothetical protein